MPDLRATEDPAAIVAAIESRSRRLETPCGEGSMVWRIWGDAPVRLVLLHGGYGSWTHWLRNIEALAKRFTVVAPDMPGLGDSAMPPEPYTAESLAAIIAEGLDRVVPASAALHLGGFSFGGLLAGHVAGLRPRVESLTLIGTSGFGPPSPPMSPLKRAPSEASWAERTAIQRDNLAILMFADERNIDALAIHLQVENRARARIRSRPIAWTDTLRRALPRVTARVGAIWGERDVTVVPYLDAKQAILRERHPEARVEVLAGIGHWVQFEAADRFNELLPEFVGGG